MAVGRELVECHARAQTLKVAVPKPIAREAPLIVNRRSDRRQIVGAGALDVHQAARRGT